MRSFSAPFQGGDLESGLPTGNSSGSNSDGSDKDADPNDSIIDKAKQDTKNLGNIIFEPSYRQLSDVDIFNYSGSLYSEFSRYPKTMPVVYREALRKGTSQLRDGLGAVYVASSGNGYLPGDEYCSKYSLATQNGNEVLLPCQIIAHLQGQLSPYTISVGAHNSEGIITYYSTPGSSTCLTAPSNNRLGSRENPVEMFPGILASDIQG
ncbi:S8 family serine peptidase [Agarilytica rhodophyticola]|uniref:S8 family serine peptidase n=1 Tax=Agarilytica rhodophyticola TaxID=1737490 RepID=UPI000B34461A|nr:S8 family serine peptidase [Agarilytica rhodophyticola]